MEQSFEPKIVKNETWGKSIIKYFVRDKNDHNIGWLETYYNKDHQTVTIAITIEEDYRGKGLGKEIYRQVPSLPSPDGRKYTFISDEEISENAKRVWDSFVKEGKALLRSDGRFEMLADSL